MSHAAGGFDSTELAEIAARLSRWFLKNQRPLPWRKGFDPYQVMVSEFMAQQTTMATVIPYFNRWMIAYPNLRALAEADQESLLKLWEGLGYYARCRNLHSAAKAIIANYGGVVPKNENDLLKLPGIGAYTAAAIVSIAFEQPAPLLDGNVRRVLSRLLAFDGLYNTPVADKFLFEQCRGLLQHGSPRVINQALMELGSLCRPKNPDCENCPLEKLCRAHNRGQASSFPKKKAKPQPIDVKMSCAVLVCNGKVAMMQASKKQWWQGLWIFPLIAENARTNSPTLNSDAWTEISQIPSKPLLSFTHSVTKHKISVQVFLSHTPKRFKLPQPLFWKEVTEVASLPIPAPAQKIYRALLDAL